MEKILEKLYQEALQLKKSIQFIDLINEKSNPGEFVIKQLIFKMDLNVKIKMYQEHHGEPHIHVDIGKSIHGASISINNPRILAGSIERKYERKVFEWISKNSDKLLIIWNNIQSGQTIDLSALN
ncbi:MULTISPECIES: DUF4160 domain-containing protein [Flavobacterium]|uniref:DUF4160 domain-containing protein n=1 Tax=Flavobacterium hankyongi TaxID=1176532 RepID=A0ABP9A9F7_9FLAO|nr:DUF4160 domain-containing protein [Flavobacterium sp. N1846]